MPLPATLSASEVQQMTRGTSNPQKGGLPATLSADEVKALGGMNLDTAPDASTKTPEPGTIFSPLKEGLSSLGTLYGGGDQGIASKLGQDVQAGASDIQKGGLLNSLKGMGKSAFRTAGDVAGTVFAPVGAAIGATGFGNALGQIQSNVEQGQGLVGQLVNKATDNPQVQQFAMTHPNANEDFGRALNLGAGALEKGKIEPSTAVARTATQMSPRNIVSKLYSVNSMAKDWTKPTEVLNASYNKARAVLDKSPDTPSFLAQQAIDPRTLISDGKYDTTDTAQNLRDTAGKMSGDTLRPSLQIADYSTPKTPVIDIKAPSTNYLQNTFHVTADDIETVSTKIQTKIDALARKYPDGMSLTDMHDENITYNKNGGFNQFKSNADTNDAIANRAIGSALDKTLQLKVPTDIGFKDFKTYLSKYYKAADYLDSLNTKKAPTSLGSYIAHKAAQVGGAAVGHGVGGGIISGVGGYMIGGALEHAIENVPNPIRAAFIRNLEVSNPEAFTKVQKYLQTVGTGKNGLLSLPPARAIIPQAPSEASQMRGRALTLPKK